MLRRLNIECDVVVLTECWLLGTSIIPQLDGYHSYATKTHLRQNDGVVIYIRNTLNVNVEEPEFTDGNCIVTKLDNHTAIISIYRSPAIRNIDNFLYSLDNILSKLNTFKNVVLIGDINIPINSSKLDLSGERYLTIAASHGLLPAHTEVTRAISSSCLDHVFLRTRLPAMTLVPQSTLTDHFPVLTQLSPHHISRHPKQTIKSTINRVDNDNLNREINNIDMAPIYESCDPNFSLNYLVTNIQSAIHNNTKTLTVSKRKKILKPWITPGLLRCMRNRDILHNKYRGSPENDVLRTTYIRYRNFCTKILKKVKRAYEKTLLESVRNRPKELWKTIKSITNCANKCNSYPEELLKLSDSKEAALNIINEYFVKVGQSLAEKHTLNSGPPISHNTQSSMSSCYTHSRSFVCEETTEEEMTHTILSLKSNSTTGCDNISSDLLKRHVKLVVPPLTHIFNKCLEYGIFPTNLKLSEVRPIYKGGDRDRVINYRPISILPSLSKVFERLLNKRLVNYMEGEGLLSGAQFGFRRNRGTDDAIHTLTNCIASNLDSGRKCLAIFLDLAKAFDTISVPILLEKLERLGIRGSQLKLFESYLKERSQCVRMGNCTSSYLSITYGVPQGSILGPTLFLVYINDLTNLSIPQGKIISYADDTALIFNANNWDEVFNYAQRGLDVVKKWLHNNILTMNSDKTKYLAFSIRNPPNMLTAEHCLIPHNCSDIDNCNCPPLERVSNFKYLGIIIDQNLSFKLHIKALTGRVRKLIYIFKTLRQIADLKLLKQVYFSLCQSIINYGIIVWGGAAKTTLKGLEIAQRAILKVYTFRPIRFPTNILYKSCEVLTVRQLFLLSIVLKQHCELKYDSNLTNKRRKHDVVVRTLHPKTSFIKRYFIFLAPYIYNKINKSINIFSLNKFHCKKKVQEFLMQLSYEETEELIQIIS